MPYDDRNEDDYRELTQRISAALLKIEYDPKIRPSQKNLAKFAECSRGTLRNRKWPLERLAEIKRQRKEKSKGKGSDRPNKDADAEIHLEDKRKLLEQLDNARKETAIWVDKYDEKERSYKKVARANDMLKAAKLALEQRVLHLERELAELKGHQEGDKNPGVVVSFSRRPKKSRKGKDGKRPSG
jgi:hypothetical protein